jgi:hypothetical protein
MREKGHEDDSLVASSAFVFESHDEEFDNLTGSRSTISNNKNTGNTQVRFWKRRWVQRVSKYWSQQSSARPDSLEYDFVATDEVARKRVPHRYDEKTVRVAPDGELYLRNRYREKV